MGWRLWACGAVALLLTCVPAQPTAGAPPLSSAGPILEEMGKKLEDQSRPALERLQIIRAFEEWGTAQVRTPGRETTRPSPRFASASRRPARPRP